MRCSGKDSPAAGGQRGPTAGDNPYMHFPIQHMRGSYDELSSTIGRPVHTLKGTSQAAQFVNLNLYTAAQTVVLDIGPCRRRRRR